jgi:hypothetical protein
MMNNAWNYQLNGKRRWYYFIRFIESIPIINFFYDVWLDDDEPPSYQRILDVLNLFALIDSLILATVATFASAFNFNELTEADQRFNQKGFQVYSGNISYSGERYFAYYQGSVYGNSNVQNSLPRQTFASTLISTRVVWSWIPAAASLLLVLFIYIDSIGKRFDLDDALTKASMIAWWRITKWTFFLAFSLLVVSVLFACLAGLSMLDIKVPVPMVCPYDPNSLTSLDQNCTKQYRLIVYTYFF